MTKWIYYSNSLSFLVVPSCKPDQKIQYGVSRNEQIRIRCEVEAEPSNDLTFRWTLNTSGSETSVEWASFTVNATTSIATYRPESSLDYGTLACMAQNSIGIQNKPCTYSIVPAGKYKFYSHYYYCHRYFFIYYYSFCISIRCDHSNLCYLPVSFSLSIHGF